MHKDMPDWDVINELVRFGRHVGPYEENLLPIRIQKLLDSIKRKGYIVTVQSGDTQLLSKEECETIGIEFKHQTR